MPLALVRRQCAQASRPAAKDTRLVDSAVSAHARAERRPLAACRAETRRPGTAAFVGCDVASSSAAAFTAAVAVAQSDATEAPREETDRACGVCNY